MIFTKAQELHVNNLISSVNLTDYFKVYTNRSLISNREISSNEFVIGINYLFDFFRLKSIIRKNISGKVSFYTAHFLNVFTQGIYFYLKKNDFLKNVCIYPDGNLLFNGYKERKWSLGNILRKIKSYLMFSKYVLVNGDICLKFEQEFKIYSYLPNTRYTSLGNCSIEVIRFGNSQDVFTSLGDDLLILGHYNQKVVDHKLIALSIDHWEESRANVFYKPHPRRELAEDSFYSELKTRIPSIEVIESNSPIESLLITRSNIGYVFAVASSSLINLKISNPNIEVYYACLKDYFGNSYSRVLEENIVTLGIKELVLQHDKK